MPRERQPHHRRVRSLGAELVAVVGEELDVARRPAASARRCGGRSRQISRISQSRARSRRSRIGTAASTRSERFRCIQSPEPIRKSPSSGSSAPAAKWKMRECSRKRPTIERMRMFSVSAGDAGREAAEAADDQVDRHAGLRGSREQQAHLADPRAGSSCRRSARAGRPGGSRSRARSARRTSARMCIGATSRVGNDGVRERPVRKWKSVTTSPVIAGSAVSSPTSSYSRAVRDVVVAGRDVGVAAHAVVLLADDERGLAVRLQPADARTRRARRPSRARATSAGCAPRRSGRSARSRRRPACPPRLRGSATGRTACRRRRGRRSS